MAFIILSHPVADFSSWKTIFDSDADRRSEAGMKEIFIGQDSEDPNMAYMIFETDNPGVLNQMMADPNLEELMKKSGVTGPPKAVIVQ